MKIYLETSIFNYYFDTERDAHPATLQLFKEIKAGKFEPYTSVYVIQELENTKGDKRTKMLNLIPQFNITIIPKNDDALYLANLYIINNIIPARYILDATHIALATVTNLDAIISLNFKHIMKKKTKIFTEYVNKSNNYRSIDFFSPMEVIENEESKPD
jgi:predicted nucleic acid-binding protein